MVVSPPLARTAILWRIYRGHSGRFWFLQSNEILQEPCQILIWVACQKQLRQDAGYTVGTTPGWWLTEKHSSISECKSTFSSYSLSWLYIWGGLMNDEAISANLSPAIHCRTTTGLWKETISGKRNWIVLIFTVHMFECRAWLESKQLSFCLHFCILLADKSHCKAKSDCNVFSPHSWAKGSSL